LPLAKRWALAEVLLAHAEDAEDPNLPLMIWFGIEPLTVSEPDRAASLLLNSRIPMVRQFIARRLASQAD
jgi:hypothetical protein